MATFILPSKLVAERITVHFPFQAELDVLEVISTWEVEVRVLVGVDPEPEDMLYEVAELDGQDVTQQIRRGLPGVIYSLICTITTSFGQTVQHTAKLAVLPSPVITPELYAVWYTTKLYPLETSESYSHEMALGSGKIRPQPFPEEYMAAAMDLVEGTLRTLLISFSTGPETFTHVLAMTEGTLRRLLLEFDAPTETFSHSLNLINGTLEDVLIKYTARPENIQVGMSPVEGTLG